MAPPRNMPFYKMHSLGNDFMVVDGVTRPFQADAQRIAAWGDRHTGVGFDQLLVIEAPTDPQADFWYRIYNADGSEAEQCGNGTRCVTHLVHHLGLSKKPQLIWQSLAGTFTTQCADNTFETQMTVPVLAHEAIPFDPAHARATDNPHSFTVEADSGDYTLTPVSMGNPHAVLFVDDLFNTDVASIGAQLTAHASFPNRTNVGFCQVVDRQFIRLRVYERGVGETQACGTGACAAVVAGRLHDLINPRVKVSLPGGKLRIRWEGPGEVVHMSGPAVLSFAGEISLE